MVRAAYRALILKYHPDTHSGTDATRRAAAINEAYAVLSDPAKRAAYDSARSNSASARASHKAGTPPPPPPPPPQPSPMPSAAAQLGPQRRHVGAWVVVALMVGLIAIGVAATRTSDAVTIAPAGSSNSVFAEPSDSVAAFATPSSPETLPTAAVAGPGSDDLKFDNIEAAAKQFDRVLQRRGISGARAFSEHCHEGLKTAPTWQAADYCAAFDIAAAHVDKAVSSALSVRPRDYFLFVNDNAADTYKPLGQAPYQVTDRLERIRKAAEPVVESAVMARLAKSEAMQKPAPVPTDNTANPISTTTTP